MSANKDTSAWILQTWFFFIISLLAATVGVYRLPIDGWAKWFMILAVFASLSGAFTLSKTIRDNKDKQIDTPAWIFQSWVTLFIPLFATAIGLWNLEAEWAIKAYVGVSFLFALSSTFTLAKTIRDNQESILPKTFSSHSQKPSNTNL